MKTAKSPLRPSPAKALVARLRGKLNQQPIADTRDNLAAVLLCEDPQAGLVKLLEKPDTKEVLDQLRKVNTTTVGHLIGFMHVYNLQLCGGNDSQAKNDLRATLADVRPKYGDLVAKKIDSSVAVESDPKHASATSSTR